VPVATIQHPLGGVPADRLASRARQVVDFVVSQVPGQGGADGGEVADDVPPTLAAPADAWEFNAFISARGWGDGFPVMQPTPERVARMLRAAGVAPGTFVGRIPPQRLDVTAEHIAANAVLAGCPDAAFPLVLTAIRAALQPEFNLLGVMATTNPCGIGVLISGPAAKDVGMNAGASLYGPGNPVNATVGRAVRLACQNLGRAWTGPVDKSTQGQPTKYSLCFAENLDESPWGPYHVDRGFAASDSTVTVIAAEGPINMHDPASTSAANFLQYVVGSMAHCGHNNLYHLGDLFLVLCPEHAAMLARDGFDRERVRQELFARARVPANVVGRETFEHFITHWPRREEVDYETSRLALTETAEQIHIAVAGGPGKHSTWLPTFGLTYSTIEKL
jgi:hypothetical protein